MFKYVMYGVQFMAKEYRLADMKAFAEYGSSLPSMKCSGSCGQGCGSGCSSCSCGGSSVYMPKQQKNELPSMKCGGQGCGGGCGGGHCTGGCGGGGCGSPVIKRKHTRRK